MFWTKIYLIWTKIAFQLQIIPKSQINTKITYTVISILLELWKALPDSFSSDHSKNGNTW